MKILIISLMLAITIMVVPNFTSAGILSEFQQSGLWTVDQARHRCFMSHSAWIRIPYYQKEQILRAIYLEEKTWWEVYDDFTNKLIGKVGGWGAIILETH